MSGKVIVRIDDVNGRYLERIKRWFDDNHPEVACAMFAFHTKEGWSQPQWGLAKELIEQRGWEIGGHTRNHVKMSQYSVSQLETIVQQNISDISEGLASVGLEYSVKSFAYPNGDHSDDVIDVLKDVGIENGLTYPEGYPYSSSESIPSGDARYRWGVTHMDEFDISIWNDRFRRAIDRGGVYILCIHPGLWDWSLSVDLYDTIDDTYRRNPGQLTKLSDSVRTVADYLLPTSSTSKWEILNEHLEYIKKHDVEFTTFSQITR